MYLTAPFASGQASAHDGQCRSRSASSWPSPLSNTEVRATCVFSPGIPAASWSVSKGPRQFSSFVRIDTIPSSEVKARRYATLFAAVSPATAGAAIDLAMQYGKDIVDRKVEATELW